jgi:hypothetical protein
VPHRSYRQPERSSIAHSASCARSTPTALSTTAVPVSKYELMALGRAASGTEPTPRETTQSMGTSGYSMRASCTATTCTVYPVYRQVMSNADGRTCQ